MISLPILSNVPGLYLRKYGILIYSLHIGKAGRIIEEIQARGFHVFGIQAFILTKKESEDFYEIYKGIEARDYFGLVRQGNIFLCSHFRFHIF